MNLAVGMASNATFWSDFRKGEARILYDSWNHLKRAIPLFKIAAVIIPQQSVMLNFLQEICLFQPIPSDTSGWRTWPLLHVSAEEGPQGATCSSRRVPGMSMILQLPEKMQRRCSFHRLLNRLQERFQITGSHRELSTSELLQKRILRKRSEVDWNDYLFIAISQTLQGQRDFFVFVVSLIVFSPSFPSRLVIHFWRLTPSEEQMIFLLLLFYSLAVTDNN